MAVVNDINVKFFTQDDFKEYVKLLRKYPPFKAEEEVEAFKRFKAGDEKAREEIIMRNQRWVYSKAKVFARDEDEVMDYVSEGTIGLIEAMDKFDIDKGNKFITLAAFYVQRAMCQYLLFDRDMITPCYNQKLYKKLDKIKSRFFNDNGYLPSIEDIKEILDEQYGIKISADEDLYDINVDSISQYVGEDTELEECTTFNDVTSVDNECLKTEETDYYRELVMPILNLLDDTSKEIIMKLYNIGGYKGYTFNDVCDEYSLTPNELKGISEKILKYMKQEVDKVNLAVV